MAHNHGKVVLRLNGDPSGQRLTGRKKPQDALRLHWNEIITEPLLMGINRESARVEQGEGISVGGIGSADAHGRRWSFKWRACIRSFS
jgi:hypothetical protein